MCLFRVGHLLGIRTYIGGNQPKYRLVICQLFDILATETRNEDRDNVDQEFGLGP
jgi:hypothetical protein